jgi:GntR family transcriptional regulator
MEVIKANIANGTYHPKSMLPPISELARELEVGRSTIREALTQLQLLGLIEIRHGKGIYISEPKIDFSSHLKSFSETIHEQGMRPGARLVYKRIEEADVKIAKHLKLHAGDPVNHIIRLRLADDLPVAVESSYLPCGPFPNLIELEGLENSLYGILHDVYHREVMYAIRSTEAVLTTPEENKLLDLTGRQPALMIETIAMDENHCPVDYGKSVYRADRFKFIVQQTR